VGPRPILSVVTLWVKWDFKLNPLRKNPEKGKEAAAPSNIKEIQEVQGGKMCHTMVVQSSPKMLK
jgi:hypothetical protein